MLEQLTMDRGSCNAQKIKSPKMMIKHYQSS
jgi:hypothetical protein